MADSLYVPDKEIKAAKSSFAIYQNEQIKYEGKDISLSNFAYKIQSGFFQAIDFEIINTVYLLKYSTSRQITTFLNYARNIEVNQSTVSKRLSRLNNSSVLARYSFFSETHKTETGTKCYVLRENGKKLLLQREYPCDWNIMQCDILLDNLKNYLARNNYLLKLLKSKVINFEDFKLENISNTISCSYTINNFKHFIIVLRSNFTMANIEKSLTQIENKYSALNNKRIIFIGEDDVHLFNIFKTVLLLIQKKIIPIKYLNDIVFTQDLRIIERDLPNLFIKYKIENNKAILEDIGLPEFI